MGCGPSKDEEEEYGVEMGPPNNVKERDFEILRVLGRGSFGKVKAAKMVNGNPKTLYALKYMSKVDLKKKGMVERVMNERNILASVSHPFIVRLIYAFQTEADLIMVMDMLTGGDLEFHLNKKVRLNELGVKFYAQQLVSAIQFLHQQNYAHRDIKPGNLLLDDKGNLFLTDFGISTRVYDGELQYTVCGTYHFMAPEILLKVGYDPKKADMWAVGVTLYFLFFRKYPCDGATVEELTRSITKSHISFSGKISEEARSLLEGLLDRDPSKRLTADTAKTHPFFAGTNWDAILRKEYFAPFTPGPEANISAQYDLEEQFAAGGKKSEKVLSEAEQESFKDWDYNPAAGIGGGGTVVTAKVAVQAPPLWANPAPLLSQNGSARHSPTEPSPISGAGVGDPAAAAAAKLSAIQSGDDQDISYADLAADIFRK
eukprot:TRINITY_DN4932_c0_g1_i1.p1 TRINITY_DN4932_c0_g1~~TRINITY_DN4932_c0_g1_i1.p1  ORF type:complete len:429 (-),score=113.12 TRINITY_DN4932_c0_g1_i1:55-1341(-)